MTVYASELFAPRVGMSHTMSKFTIIAALGNLKSLAQERDRVLVRMLCNELKFYSWLREKMPIAFFKISRS
jgi:hypothetical protein